ncbi:MAG: [protein-PII] uridylyltransferase [Paracoccaceae bacterium]
MSEASARRPATATFAGLGHLAACPEEIASRERLIEAIDALAIACAPAAHETRARPAREHGAAPNRRLRAEVVTLLAEPLRAARARVRRALIERPEAGLRVARAFAHATDVAVAGAVHYVTRHACPRPIRSENERLSVIAVGGYGRGEMAPYSDVDLLFLTPWKRNAWSESAVETILYVLWDLKLKLGHATRSVADCLRLAREDVTIRTTLLEMRPIAGDAQPAATLEQRLWDELFLRTGPEFVAAKLAERDARHARHGGSRYLVEPNVKEGKGGLRDLQTLHWISRYLYRTEKAWALCDLGVFEREEVGRFAEAAKFLWAVRHHLHDLSGRAAEVLSFDRQVEIAARFGYADADGRLGVERFMHRYFRHAKDVGDLTRIFSAALEAQHAKERPRFSMLMRAMSLKGAEAAPTGPFVVRDGRLALADDGVFEREPIAILRLFREAARVDARIHPAAMRAVTRALDLIDDNLRADRQANALFLDLLMDRQHAPWLLGMLNETGVLGRFVPAFGRVVAMMQFNMYHHYTVDEHTLETLRTLARIERGEADDEHPVAAEIVRQGLDRRVLYVALLLHDLGKGLPEEHSEVGARIAEELCPRFGLCPGECERVVWLVRHHLMMSDVAQKRDIADQATIETFARAVQSPEKLRLLLVFTVCDIRGVGPGVWNNWKAQLLRKLYWDTRARLTSGDGATPSRAARITEAKAALAEELASIDPALAVTEAERHYPQYWLGLDREAHLRFALLAAEAAIEAGEDGAAAQIHSHVEPDPERDATVVALYMHDHPGLFSRMAGAFAIAGADVVDARSYTTVDGMACAMFWIQDAEGAPYEVDRLPRLRRAIERTLKGEVVAREVIDERRRERARDIAFTLPTRGVFDNEASELYTVIEVDARDRLGLLHALARALSGQNVNIFTAVIATYGERAVDVFYVKDLFGLKIRNPAKQRAIEGALERAVADGAVPVS